MKPICRSLLVVVCLVACSFATEVLRPVLPPTNSLAFKGAFELDEDIYSGDLVGSAEIAPLDFYSIYVDASYRLISCSYEYSTKGYIHNWANLHVNGFNETYVGAKMLVSNNAGLELNWRFPPGEGSRKNRFHRFGFVPFAVYQFNERLMVGTSFGYYASLEDLNYKPGDEVGFKASFVWKPFRKAREISGWQITEVFLYQSRIQESQNRNMLKPYRKMDDKYRGMKMLIEAERYFDFFGLFPLGVGLNYEIHEGYLFGFETGHKIGFSLKIQ